MGHTGSKRVAPYEKEAIAGLFRAGVAPMAIARKVGRPYQTVVSWLRRVGHLTGSQSWTSEEEAIVRDMTAEGYTAKGIARVLARTQTAIYRKFPGLKVAGPTRHALIRRLKASGMSAADIAKEVGTSMTDVMNATKKRRAPKIAKRDPEAKQTKWKEFKAQRAQTRPAPVDLADFVPQFHDPWDEDRPIGCAR